MTDGAEEEVAGQSSARDVAGWEIIRFLGDGTVLRASAMPEEKLKNVLKWLTPKPSEMPVRVTLAANRISFSETNPAGATVAYDGTWSGEKLELEVSSTDGYRAARSYEFFSEEQLATKRAK